MPDLQCYRGATHTPNQAYITLEKEEDATVAYELAALRRKWGEDVSILTKNGLPLTDEPATRGIHNCYNIELSSG